MTAPGEERGARKQILPPRAPDAAAEWEVEHHLEELADRLVEEGMSPQDARSEAERRFGDPARYRAMLEGNERRRRRTIRRTEWRGVVLSGLARAARSLRQSPGFTTAVVLTLALGIGANATMFGILDRLLFQPPEHVAQPDGVKQVTLVRPFEGAPTREGIGVYQDYLGLRKVKAFQAIAAYFGPQPTTLGSGPDATRVQVTLATWDFFPLLGVHAERGRFFTESDDRPGATPTAVVSDGYWRSKMGGDPDVVGRTLELAGHAYTIVGVAPAGFTGVELSSVDVWVPLVTAGVLEYNGAWWMHFRGFRWLNAVARLAPGATLEAADAAATAAYLNGRREEVKSGRYPKGTRIALDPLVVARGPEASSESKVARWLGGVSLLVLLIACANVANLLLARGTRRRREVAVRLALGVGRARLVTTMAVESVLLALLGGSVALALAAWGGGLVRRALIPGVLFPGPALDGRILLFVLVAALAAGLLAGVGPALQATRVNLGSDLAMGAGSASARRSWTRAGLTVVQAALSVVLLVGAGLFVRSVSAVHHVDLGLDMNRLVLASIEFETHAMESAGKGAAFQAPRTHEQNQIYEEAMQRLRDVPGVASVAGTESPFQSAYAQGLKVPGLDSIPRLPGGGPYFVEVTPGYFRTVGVKVMQGRVFVEGDRTGAQPVAIVSERMARALWPDQDPLGKCVMLAKDKGCTTVVGVVEDAARHGVEDEASMTYYLPLAQHPDDRINGLYVRASGDVDPVRLTSTVAPMLRSLDPRIRYASVAPLRDKLAPQERSWKLGATMFTIFGVLALVVAAIGLYGVLAFDVAQRTRELGIRTALGAERARLLWGVVGRGLGLASVGVVLGLGVALVAAPYVRDLLFKVSPRDPDVLTGVAVALMLVAVVASLVPGVRATKVDPMVALRTE